MAELLAADTAPLTYPAITVWQPWATLIAEEAKRFEFRSWCPSARLIGQRVAIHAGARKISVAETRALLVKLHSPAWRETGLHRERAIETLELIKRDPAAFPLSSVVCFATMGQPIGGAELGRALGLALMNDSDRHEHTNWGWPLSEIERLSPPRPARGAQGWWKWTAHA